MATQKSTDLATRIVKQKAEVTEANGGYDFDLAHVIGRHYYVAGEVPAEKEGDKPVKVKKTDATTQAIEQLADELDSGNLELSNAWEKDNLKN